MDLKELYLRQRVAAASAVAATSQIARLSHRKLAASYAERIENFDENGEGRHSPTRSLKTGTGDDAKPSVRSLPGPQADTANR